MDNFVNLKFSNCCRLVELIGDTGQLVERLGHQYADYATHYESTVEFLVALGIVRIHGDRLELTRLTRSEVGGLRTDQLNKRELSRNIAHRLTCGSNRYATQVKHFLSGFRMVNGKMYFKPVAKTNLENADLRNFLIELELIEGESSIGFVVIDESVTLELFDRSSRRMGRKELLQVQEQREYLGRLAELEVIAFEKRRLIDFPDLVRNIEHTAEQDVGAGYDIKSYQGSDSTNPKDERYIEVKAVSRFSYHFFWSFNEINVARSTRNKYYLYLLPVWPHGKFGLSDLNMIQDPIERVFENDRRWSRSCELLRFWMNDNDETNNVAKENVEE